MYRLLHNVALIGSPINLRICEKEPVCIRLGFEVQRFVWRFAAPLLRWFLRVTPTVDPAVGPSRRNNLKFLLPSHLHVHIARTGRISI